MSLRYHTSPAPNECFQMRPHRWRLVEKTETTSFDFVVNGTVQEHVKTVQTTRIEKCVACHAERPYAPTGVGMNVRGEV